MNTNSNVGKDFHQYLRKLGEQADPQSGFFGPTSLLWRISREPVLLLFGMRALLLQIAHPHVAQAVADHSNYRSDPLGRGIRTFKAVYAMIFGPRETAIESALAVHIVHTRVYGEIKDPLPHGINPHYKATDPQSLLWVAATLLDSSVLAYELCVRQLSTAEKEQFYQESKRFGQLFGVPERLYPGTWEEFQIWMTTTIQSEQITVIPAAKDILYGLLFGTWFTRLLAPINYSVAAMSLPPKLAKDFGFKQSWWTRGFYKFILILARGATQVIPQRYRAVPAARANEYRLKQAQHSN
ncbi:oxygenase MpaB family protein [Kaarinaea lacus]